ncbi:hypothetical protein ACFLZJ_00540 [Nanoarchaeota archaeon]
MVSKLLKYIRSNWFGHHETIGEFSETAKAIVKRKPDQKVVILKTPYKTYLKIGRHDYSCKDTVESLKNTLDGRKIPYHPIPLVYR